MTILSVKKDNKRYHAIQNSICSKEDLKIFSGCGVMNLNSVDNTYLINRELILNINDWLLKDVEGNLLIIKNNEFFKVTK
jgi:hypothetical protein